MLVNLYVYYYVLVTTGRYGLFVTMRVIMIVFIPFRPWWVFFFGLGGPVRATSDFEIPEYRDCRYDSVSVSLYTLA